MEGGQRGGAAGGGRYPLLSIAAALAPHLLCRSRDSAGGGCEGWSHVASDAWLHTVQLPATHTHSVQAADPAAADWESWMRSAVAFEQRTCSKPLHFCRPPTLLPPAGRAGCAPPLCNSDRIKCFLPPNLILQAADTATSGWEGWMRSAWRRWNRTKDAAGDSWDSAKDQAYR